MRGRPSKGRKTKSRSKAAKATRARSSKSKTSKSKTSKSKKASRTRKTSKAAAKRGTARKQAPARKKAGRKTGSRAPGRGRARKDVFGEGNYTASREFRQDETRFVQRNRNRIPELGEEAADALEGSEGNELRQAEETARSHSAGDDED